MRKEAPLILEATPEQREVVLFHDRVVDYPIHGHAYYELLVYDIFEGELTLNGSKFSALLPTAILVTPNDFHGTSLRGGACAACFKLQLRRSVAERIAPYALLSAVTQEPAQVAFLRALCHQAERHREDPDYLLKCAELLVLTLQKNAMPRPAHGKSVALIRAATDIILQRFQEPLTLEGVAALLHVSAQYLSTVFARYAEMSFVEYLTDRRLRYAASAMQHGANVTEACFQSGYRNLSHFIRSFKKKYHVTPARFAREGEADGSAR